MSLTIRKKGSKNFWHYFTIDGSDFEYSASDIVIIFDGNYVKLRATNGRIIGEKDGYLYSNVTLYDDTGAGTPLTYASAILLEQALIDLGYIAFYEDGDVVLSLQDLTDVEITSLTNGQALIYNSTSGKWENTTLGGGTGTVTSVAVSGSDGIEVDSGSPITTSGTIALGINKTTLLNFLGLSDTYVLGLAFGDETSDMTTGTAKLTFQMPNFATTLVGVSVNVKTAPTGSIAVFDLNENGTTVLSTQISIDAGETTSETATTPPVISDSSLAANAIMTVDIDQVGSTVAGVAPKIWIYYKRA